MTKRSSTEVSILYHFSNTLKTHIVKTVNINFPGCRFKTKEIFVTSHTVTG